MAANVPTACRTPGCSGTCYPETGHSYCEDCEAAKAKEATTPQPAHLRWPIKKPKGAERTEHDRILATSQWKNRTSPTMKACNPLCQRVLPNGKQCWRAAKEVHHLDDNPTLFFNPANLVGLCAEHHPKSQGENPNDPREYVPTKWIGGAVFPHPKIGQSPSLLAAIPEPQAPSPTVDFTKLLNLLPPKPPQNPR
jgi:hypothetical protein